MTSDREPRALRPALGFLVAVGLVAIGLATSPCLAQVRAPGQSASSVASAPAHPASGRASATKAAVRQQTRPLWSELTGSQRQALTPLSATWDALSEAQKRKWLALSQNFPKMSADEQAKLHSRMTEWVALSPQQRTQARLNYGKTQQISPGDKKAQWEAYQALPPEEKNKLAARAAKPPATAAAIKPVAPEKLTKVPPPTHGGRPRIEVGANQVDPNTLLPQQAHGNGPAN